MLAMFVSNIMGGTQMDDVVAANGIVKLSDQVISYVKSAIVTFLGHDMKEEAGERVIHLFMEYFPLSLTSVLRHQRDTMKKPLPPTILRIYALEVAKGLSIISIGADYFIPLFLSARATTYLLLWTNTNFPRK